MRFKLEIKSESDKELETRRFLDEDHAIDESMKKLCIVAYI